MVRPGSAAPMWGAAGKAGYALSCVAAALVLAVSGFCYFVVRDVSSIGGSHAINSGPSIGAQNILLMGLESRTDWNGNVLPNNILNALHAGSRQGVLERRRRERDQHADPDPHPGRRQEGDRLLDPARRLGYLRRHARRRSRGQDRPGLRQTRWPSRKPRLEQQHPGMSQNQVAFQGNEAGRAAAVASVESLTGVHIDHFAEVNLDGFYELANVLGGVEVCLKHAVPLDTYSGFYAQKAGYQHLNARMALAFVRQRHGLPNGDLDRTHRQQAFLDSVMQQLRTEGVLERPDQDQLAAVGGQAVRDHRLRLEPARLRHPDAQPDQRQPELPYAADHGLRDHRRPGRQRSRTCPYIQQLIHNTFYPAPASSSSSKPKPARHGHGQRGRGRRDHGRRVQRRQHPGAGRAGLGRPGEGRVQGRADREHHRTAHDPGAVRRRRGGERAPGSRRCSASPRRRAPRWRRGTSR